MPGDNENADTSAAQDVDSGDEEAPLNGNAKDEDEGPGCCFYYGQCLLNFFKACFAGITGFFAIVGDLLGYCWYPFKERAADCCECCGKRMNPHLDPNFSAY